MKYFCTLFDKNYLIKGLTMIKSLSKNCKNFKIYVLCLDDETQYILEENKINQISCIALKDIEDDELLYAKQSRTNTEYCWTLASYFTWKVLMNNLEIDLITYLDADLLFYSDVEPIFKEIGNSSIAIIEHRFSPQFKYLEINGRFCVEWNSFRRDKEGINCLDIWRKQCLEWCFYKNEEDKMGDQKYLDEWPNQYDSCHIIKNLGAGIAPWNYSQYKIIQQNNLITINNTNLIFYHFHQFQILENNKFFRLSGTYTSKKAEPNNIYEIYEKEILETISQIKEINPKFKAGILKKHNFIKEKIKYLFPRKLKKVLRRFL